MIAWLRDYRARNKENYVYVLRCCGDNYYVGETGNLVRRLHRHICGYGSKFTKKYLPCELVHLEFVESYPLACEMEKVIDKMVQDGWRDFFLPEEYEEIFYRVFAFSYNNPMEELVWTKESMLECESFIDMPYFVAANSFRYDEINKKLIGSKWEEK